MREQLIRAVEIIPLEVVVRKWFAAGSISKRLGIEEGTPLPRPIVEFYFKNDELGDPLVQRGTYHRPSAGPRSRDLERHLVSLALRVNDFLSGLIAGRRHPAGGISRSEIGRIWDGTDNAPHRGRRDQPGVVSELWDITETGTRLRRERCFRRRILGQSSPIALYRGSPPACGVNAPARRPGHDEAAPAHQLKALQRPWPGSASVVFIGSMKGKMLAHGNAPRLFDTYAA